ncbi:FprA family A-type flavoprotein [Alloiococcus sp. CFN-8]|uniref:FprA family A-type flavoprotein n=1 Tax=Alloiococcus sp. CFN-8 TaxID=3416081 RepID=UPI003CE673E7
MHCTQNITPSIHWVGGNDRRIALFENMFPLDNGVAYNSYLIMDEKVTLMDTVDSAITEQFFENLYHVLNGRAIDYLVVNHMEPDHCANIEELTRRFPNMKIIGNKKTFQMIEQFYDFDAKDRYLEVTNGETLSIGSHTLKFIFTPMVHWPEVMMVYEESEKILFSADAFGSFGALSGNLFNDEIDYKGEYLVDFRRYYTNIVGRYGAQVQAVLKKLSALDIQMICPLHGVVWRSDLEFAIDKYNHWSSYTPEVKSVVFIYASMYNNTENAMNVLANKLAQKGVKNMHMYDVSKTTPSTIIADAFKYSNIVFGAPLYNNSVYLPMEALIADMALLNLRGRKVSLVGNSSWIPDAVGPLKEAVMKMKNTEIVGEPFQLKSSLKPGDMESLDALAEAIYQSLQQ